MMGRNTSVNKITIINIVSTFTLQGISFLTIPIFTRMLGSEQYGIFSIYNSWVVILTCFMGFNVGSSIGTGKYHFKDEYEEYRSCTLLLGTILSSIIILLLAIFIIPLSGLMGYGMMVYIIMLITSFATFVINFVQLSFIYEKKALSNLILSVSLSLLTVALSVFLIHQMAENEKYIGRILGYSIPYIVVAAVVWGFVFFKKPVFLKKEYVKYALLISIPVIFHALSQNILAQSDRVMMQQLNVSNSEIGQYSLYYTFAGVMVTVLSAFNNSWCPFYYDGLERKDWDGINKKVKNYTEIFTVLMVGFVLLSREVGYLLSGEDFWAGIEIIPIISLSCFFTFLYQFPVNFEFYQKKTILIAVGTFLSAALNVGLNLIFIPLWGIYGAAFTTALSYFALFLIHLIIVKINKKWEYNIKFLYFLIATIIVALSCFAFYALKDYPIIRWGLGAMIGIFEIIRLFKRKTVF